MTFQAREKFLSLRKGTKSDVASLLEEVLCSTQILKCSHPIFYRIDFVVLNSLTRSNLVLHSPGTS